MTWFAAGAAAVSFATNVYSANSSAQKGAKAAGARSKAEGEAIATERLNYTIRNAYGTALSQMQLGLKKKQLSQQGADISAARLMAKGSAQNAVAATGSLGASTAAVSSDIDMKSQSALDMTTDSFESAVENYNMDLDMMVLNTQQTAHGASPVEYIGPGAGEIVGTAALGALGSFAMDYASRKMSLGLGKGPNGAPPPEPRAASNVSMFSGASLGTTSDFFSRKF